MPKVSIILPIYNVAPYLDDAFNSLIHQTLKDIEIIAINDGSTDNSQAYIEKYMALDSRISCYQQENQGLSNARNAGMRYVTGEYVYFMDSDDIIEKDALEICYEYSQKNKSDICIFDADCIYEKNINPIPWNYDRSDVLDEHKRYNGEELFHLLIDTSCHRAVVWLQFIKWDYLNNLKLSFFPNIIHEDELFTPQLILSTNNIYYVNRKFVKHRIRNSSIQGKRYSKRNIDCYLTVIDELFKFQDSPIIQKLARYTLDI